jgi:hypothetical protein
VFLQPVASAGGDDALVITGNTIGPATVVSGNSIGGTGITVQNAVSPNISGNTIQNVIAPSLLSVQGWPTGIYSVNTSGASISSNVITNVTTPVLTNAMWATGILVDSSTTSGTTISDNKITNVAATATSPGSGNIVSAYGIYNGAPGTSILRNTITTVSAASTSGCPARGIWLTGSSSNITVAGNAVSDIVSYSLADSLLRWSPVGIYVDPNGQNLKLYYNSVSLFGSHPGTTGGTLQAALFIDGSGSESGYDVRDNVLVDTYDNSTDSTDGSYAIYVTHSRAHLRILTTTITSSAGRPVSWGL